MTTPKYTPVAGWCDLTGTGRSWTYEALGRGDLRAIKLGKKTLIDVDHGLAYLASMPEAKITTRRRAARLSECSAESSRAAAE